MTTMTSHERPTLPLRPDPVMQRAVRVDQIEREARIKRLGLVGALALFLSFFGLAIAVDARDQVSAGAASAPSVIYIDDPGMGTAMGTGSGVTVAPPRVRTRSS